MPNVYLCRCMEANYYLIAKALHIIFMVAWFAGLFYTPRLFIYQVEAKERDEPARSVLTAQLQLMTRRLWYIITWPAGILTTLFAIWMLWLLPGYLQAPWMHLKLGLVVLLFGYHGSLHWLFAKLQKEEYPMGAQALRMYNEVATLLLFAIIFTVVFKDTSAWYYGLAGLVGLALLLMLGVKAYKKQRERRLK